ncbi:MAG: MarR family transcriptional regulator [Solirubrobacteraceae bacterium]|nr:MarR family transcriptional regulator [Patulibacter sp.]
MPDLRIAPSSAVAARELRANVGRLRRLLQELTGALDFTPSQTAVLSQLIRNGAASTSDLAAAERIRPQSMAALLTALEERQMIERRADPSDGRRQLIDLSEHGRALIEDDRHAREEWLAQTFERDFTERERQTVIEAFALLERLTRP